MNNINELIDIDKKNYEIGGSKEFWKQRRFEAEMMSKKLDAWKKQNPLLAIEDVGED